jgi:hypothetical protein
MEDRHAPAVRKARGWAERMQSRLGEPTSAMSSFNSVSLKEALFKFHVVFNILASAWIYLYAFVNAFLIIFH